MPPLQVVTQPNNVPAAPLPVVSQPQQPTLAPHVQSAPAAPQPAALPVQSAPSAPQQNLQVQQQPANQQQSVSVQLPPIVTAIQTAINRGADPATILKAIGDQNPAQQVPIQTALSRGATPQQVLTEIVQQNSGLPPNPQDAPPQHVGFIQSLVQSIARPFLRPVVGLYDATAATVKAIQTGNRNGPEAQGEVNKERDLGYFGKVKPTTFQSIGSGAGKSFLDTTGTGVELAANFVGGEGAVAAGEDFIKSAAGAAVKQGIKEGAKAGGLAGFGSALQDENPTIGSVAEKTIGGTIGGGITGGLVTGLPALAISTSKALKNTIAPSVEAALTKAIKPAKNNTGWFDAIKNVVPDIQETAAKAKLPINNLDDLSTAIKLTKDRIWKSYSEILGPNADHTIEGTQVADAMINSLDKRTQVQNPALVERLTAKADTYRWEKAPVPAKLGPSGNVLKPAQPGVPKKLSLADAEDFLQSANNDLHNFYAKNKVGQKVAASDPEYAPILAEANALRDALYSKLNDLTGKDAALLKKKYGDLSNIQNEVIGRKNVAARQNPDSLAEQIGYAQAAGKVIKSVANMRFGDAAEGVAQAATSHYLKSKNGADALIQSAFSRLGKRR